MATEIDPICQMDVDTDNPPGGQSEYNDGTYYFCAAGCKVAFDKEPEKYITAGSDSHDGHGHDHGHDHGGIFGERTELIFALLCGLVLGIGFAIEKLAAAPEWVPLWVPQSAPLWVL